MGLGNAVFDYSVSMDCYFIVCYLELQESGLYVNIYGTTSIAVSIVTEVQSAHASAIAGNGLQRS